MTPQGVPPADLGFGQGQLGVGVEPLAAGEHLHGCWPSRQQIPYGAFAQPPGQIGDVRLFDPAFVVGAAVVAAGVPAAFKYLTAGAQRGLSGLARDCRDRLAFPLAQLPPD